MQLLPGRLCRNATASRRPIVSASPRLRQIGGAAVEARHAGPTCGRCSCRCFRCCSTPGSAGGWRRRSARPAAGVALALVLVVSALSMRFALGMRRRVAAGRLRERLAGSAWSAIGLFSSLLVLTVLRDVGLLGVVAADALRPGWLGVGAASRGGWSAQRSSPPALRRHRLGLRRTRGAPRAVRRVDVPIAGLPAALHGFTIVQISDIHVGPTISAALRRARSSTRSTRCDADVVAITGDLVDGSVRELARARRAARAACARATAPTSSPATTSTTRAPPAWVARAAPARPARAAERARGRLGAAAPTLVVAGVTDFSARHFDPAQAQRPGARARRRARRRRGRACCSRTSRAAPRRPRRPASTCSSRATPTAASSGPGTSSCRLQQPFTAGLHRWRRLWVYTSRGTGYWGPPKRFGAPSEITRLRLVRRRPAPSRPRPPGPCRQWG